MSSLVKIGVPVVIEVNKLNPPPEWLRNFNSRDFLTPLGPLERSIHFIQKNSDVWYIFPNEKTYTMFLLKWG